MCGLQLGLQVGLLRLQLRKVGLDLVRDRFGLGGLGCGLGRSRFARLDIFLLVEALLFDRVARRFGLNHAVRRVCAFWAFITPKTAAARRKRTDRPIRFFGVAIPEAVLGSSMAAEVVHSIRLKIAI